MANSYISNFIDSLSLVGDSRALACVLFKTEKDCKDFYIGFLNRNRYVVDDLLDYREARLATSDTSLDTFIGLCDNIVKQEVLEQTFLQSLSNDEVELINKAIVDGKVSLETIYNRFQNNVNENILKYVL